MSMLICASGSYLFVICHSLLTEEEATIATENCMFQLECRTGNPGSSEEGCATDLGWYDQRYCVLVCLSLSAAISTSKL